MPDIIDRDTYRKIKKMSREELQAFLVRYANNISGNRSIDLRKVEADLKTVKGIGKKRLEEIMTIIEKHLDVPDCFPAQNITNAPAHLCTGTFSVIGKKDQYRTQPYLFRAPFVLLTSCVSSVLSVLFTLPSPLISAAR